MPEILKGALNARVPPRRVLLRHAHHEVSDVRKDPAPTSSPARVRPLTCDQLSVPSEEGVGCYDRRHLLQGCPAQAVSSYGKSAPVVIGEPQPAPPDLPAEQTILFEQIGERLSLSAIEPASDGQKQQPKD